MTITCIAIDDEPLALALMRDYCERVPFIRLIGSYTDAVEAAQVLRLDKTDLLLLDIQMPDITGLHVARNTGYRPQIVFTTAHSQYAVEGFDMDVADYLLKPFGFERFIQAMEKVRKRLAPIPAEPTNNTSVITFKSAYQNVEVRCDEILYAEAMDNYAIVYTGDKKHIAHCTLKLIEDQLPAGQFVRVHRSFIVNRLKINSFTKSSIQIGLSTIPIGRSYTATFAQYMQTGV